MKNAILKILVVAAMAVSANALADVNGNFDAEINTRSINQIGVGGLVNSQKMAVGSAKNVNGNFTVKINTRSINQIGVGGLVNSQKMAIGSQVDF